jgi:hypothetical protein
MQRFHQLTSCGRRLLDRRGFLGDAVGGLGAIALARLLNDEGLLAAAAHAADPVSRPAAPLAAREGHFPARAKRVLMIFCAGGCSQLDTWDYKPELIKRDGQPLPGHEKLITFQGPSGNLARSPYAFRQHGQCGKYVSDLLPHLAAQVDQMCFIHSLVAESNTHGPAECQMNTGRTTEGFPSIGSWASYALGSESNDLPAFVAIPDPRGLSHASPANWSSGFLPAVYEGTSFSGDRGIANLALPSEIAPAADRAARDVARLLNERHLARHGGDSDLAARIASYELAAKLQTSAPEVCDLARESSATAEMYGANDVNPPLAGFARNCLLARRLLERGVRFVQLFNGAYAIEDDVANWDSHKALKADYDRHGPILDRPVAALLRDLDARGLLADTLVVCATEFGRMPMFQQGALGRDHNPEGFTVWLAGAGVKRGFSYGATDEFGYRAVENRSTIYDLHATILHLLGLDHTRLTYTHNGAERRLTDMHGRVIDEILA